MARLVPQRLNCWNLTHLCQMCFLVLSPPLLYTTSFHLIYPHPPLPGIQCHNSFQGLLCGPFVHTSVLRRKRSWPGLYLTCIRGRHWRHLFPKWAWPKTLWHINLALRLVEWMGKFFCGIMLSFSCNFDILRSNTINWSWIPWNHVFLKLHFISPSSFLFVSFTHLLFCGKIGSFNTASWNIWGWV